MRVLRTCHRCIPRVVKGDRRRLCTIVLLLGVSVLFFVTLTIVWDNTRHWRTVTFRCDSRPSVLGTHQSEMIVSRLDCDRREVRSLSTDVASTKIGVFIVVERMCEDDIREYEYRNSDLLLIDCQRQFVYYIYILSSHFASSQLCLNFWTERLSAELDRCRRSSRHASGRVINVAKDVNIVSALNSIMIEAYVDDVTWFDVATVTNLTKSAKVRTKMLKRVVFGKSGDGAVSSIASYDVDERYENTRIVIHKYHYEIVGVFFPRSLLTTVDASQYAMGVFTNCANPERTADFKRVESTNNAVLRVNVIEMVHKTCSLAARYWLSKLPNRTDSVAPRRTIAMSLYGDKPLYTMGAVRNAQLAPVLFPGWRLRFYCAPRNSRLSVPASVISKLKDLGAEIVYVEERISTKLAPMIWRFLIADDLTDEAFIIRDADSRFSQREATAVSAWLSRTPRKTFHCMRDHPWHNFAIMGGMWGARTQELRALLGGRSLLSIAWEAPSGMYKGDYLDDMKFLEATFWKNYSDHFYCHDSVLCKSWVHSHPFPSARVGDEHVGQVFNEFSEANENHLGPIKNLPAKSECS